MTLRTELLSETLFSLWIEAWNQPTMEQQQTLRALRSDDAHHSTWSPAHLSDYYSLTFQQPADSPAPSPPPAISRWWTFKTGSILTVSNADFHSALISCSIPKGSVLESSPLQHVHGPIWSWSPDNMTSVQKCLHDPVLLGLQPWLYPWFQTGGVPLSFTSEPSSNCSNLE